MSRRHIAVRTGELTIWRRSGREDTAHSTRGIHPPPRAACASFDLKLCALGHSGAFRLKHHRFIFSNISASRLTARECAVPVMRRVERSTPWSEHASCSTSQHRDQPNFPPIVGGQQQRVAIARALVHEPRLVVCDEPTAALDAKSGRRVMDLLREVALSADRAVIIVTHDNRIFDLADRILVIEDGRIVSDGKSAEALAFQEQPA